MRRLAGPIGVLLLIVNLGIAAAWVTVLHPGAPTAVGRAAPDRNNSPHAVHVTGSGPQGVAIPIAVPPMLVPGSVQFSPLGTSGPVVSPHGERVAQLASIPPDLAGSIGAVFPSPQTPVNAPQRPAGPPDSPDLVGINFAVLSEIRYQGTAGTVYVSTGRPSTPAASRGLGLGGQSYTLPDGTTAWVMQSTDPATPDQVRWLANGLLITVAGTVPLDRLEALAGSITLK